MFASTEGNCVIALTLGSQDCSSTAWASCSPFNSECCCTQRSASTISVGYVEAARICATSASGYSATGATNCSNCSGLCWSTASPTAAGGSGAADACEQHSEHAAGTAIHDLIIVTHTSARAGSLGDATGAPTSASRSPLVRRICAGAALVERFDSLLAD